MDRPINQSVKNRKEMFYGGKRRKRRRRKSAEDKDGHRRK